MNATTINYYDVFEVWVLNCFNNRLTDTYQQAETPSGWQTSYISKSDGRLVRNEEIKAIINRVDEYVTSDGEIVKLTSIDPISDGVEVNEGLEVLSLLEIKCHKCFSSRSPIGDVFFRIRTNGHSIKTQWDALVKTDLPYCIFIGYHWLSKKDLTIENLKINDMSAVCLIGKGNKFAILQSSLGAFDHTICAKTIMRLLSELITYDKQQVLAYTDTVSEQLFWLHNESKLLSQLSQLALPEDIQQTQPEPMPEPTTKSIDDYPRSELAKRRLAGESVEDIANDLKAQNYVTRKGNTLNASAVGNEIAPTQTLSVDFSRYQQEIKQAFLKALNDGSKCDTDHIYAEEVPYLQIFLHTVVKKMYADSAVRKWYRKHPQATMFAQLKQQAIDEYLAQDTLAIVQDNPKHNDDDKQDALENIQSTLNVILDKLLELESDQNKLKELDQTVHILMDTIERHIK